MRQSLMVQVMVVSFVSFLATAGVYGLVALLVRMDDTGIYLADRARSMTGMLAKVVQLSGNLLITALPWCIRFLSVTGTIAMLLVGGGMYVHNIEVVHHAVDIMPPVAGEFVTGLFLGAILVTVMHFIYQCKAEVKSV